MSERQPIKDGDKFNLFDRAVTVRRAGPQQSEIKWPDGKETIVPNSWLVSND